ncbi:hypothetical protein [Prevotella sp. kh1p2]|uniref:hypothetical protein n=1 Tax=Prevotella sp. kh1p2 TaxID=1761883 RepID=UPI0015A557FA|nr:hypothetical protein [Prevotella sp. kh1p2]
MFKKTGRYPRLSDKIKVGVKMGAEGSSAKAKIGDEKRLKRALRKRGRETEKG